MTREELDKHLDQQLKLLVEASKKNRINIHDQIKISYAVVAIANALIENRKVF